MMILFEFSIFFRRIVIATKRHVEQVPGREGEHGELLVKSPYMFDRYFDNPKATEESFAEGKKITMRL